jgi:protein TonB
MFEQSLMEVGKKKQKSWTLGVAVCLQTAMVGAGLMVPLVSPELLPDVVLTSLLMEPSPPPPAAAKAQEFRAAAAAQTRQVASGRVFEPARMPAVVRTFVDEPERAFAPAGVPWGIPQGLADGMRDGVVGSLLHGIEEARPPAERPATQEARKETAPVRIRVGGEVQDALLVHRIVPAYPSIAKQTRTQGTVVLTAVISREGRVAQLQVISGNVLLVQAAVDAVKQWRYRPTMLNGEPVEVLTTIEVNFRLTQ